MHHTLTLLALHLLVALPLQAQESSEPSGLTYLAQSDREGPVTVMDLVKFLPGGEDHYDQYDALAEAKLTSLGGEVVFRGYSRPFEGRGADREAARIGGYPSILGWDRVTMRKYPSAAAVVEMGSSSEYGAAFPYRVQGVERSLVYAFGGEAMPRVPSADAPDAVYMLNLLRFTGPDGEAGYSEYGRSVGPMLREAGARPVLSMTGLTAVVSEEVIDRMILVYYPSPESFLSMVESPGFPAVMHQRSDAVDLGLNLPFTDRR